MTDEQVEKRAEELYRSVFPERLWPPASLYIVSAWRDGARAEIEKESNQP